MSKFKKVFRGYAPAQVDEEISILETEIASTKNKNDRLEDAATQLELEKADLKSKVKGLEEKLEKALQRQAEILRGAEAASLSKEALAKIYLQAFESGEKLARSPQNHIEGLLNSINGVSEKTKREFKDFGADFLSSTEKIQKLSKEIIEYNQSVIEKVKKLSEGFEELKDTYSAIDKVNNLTNSDINSVMDTYRKEISEFISNQDKQPSVSIMQESVPVFEDIKTEFADETGSAADFREVETTKEETTPANITNHITLEITAAQTTAKPEMKDESTADDFINTVNTSGTADISDIAETAEGSEATFDSEDARSDFLDAEGPDEEENSQSEGTSHDHDIMNLLNKYHKK